MTNWYYKNGYEPAQGPYDEVAMRQKIQSGHITAPTQVRLGDDGDWYAASEIPGLLTSAVTPQSPPSSSYSPPNYFPSSGQDFSFDKQKMYQAAEQTFKNISQKASLFDIRFTKFFTNTWISIIWGIVIFAALFAYVIVAVTTLYPVIYGHVNPIYGIFMLLLETISLVVGLLAVRIGLELIIIIFRIETHLRAMCERQ